jgi:hypothetical protein
MSLGDQQIQQQLAPVSGVVSGQQHQPSLANQRFPDFRGPVHLTSFQTQTLDRHLFRTLKQQQDEERAGSPQQQAMTSVLHQFQQQSLITQQQHQQSLMGQQQPGQNQLFATSGNNNKPLPPFRVATLLNNLNGPGVGSQHQPQHTSSPIKLEELQVIYHRFKPDMTSFSFWLSTYYHLFYFYFFFEHLTNPWTMRIRR